MEYGIDNSFECLTILGRYQYAVRFRRVLSDAIMIVDNFKLNINAIRKVLEWFVNTECIVEVFKKTNGYKSLRLHGLSPTFVVWVLYLLLEMRYESMNRTLRLVDQKE